MRALDTPVMVHMDHVSAVLDVDYSPTGKEFVSASFDKSIRIFPMDKSRSRYVLSINHLFLFNFSLSWLSFFLVVCTWWGSHPSILTWSTSFHCIIYGWNISLLGSLFHWTRYCLYLMHWYEILLFALRKNLLF